MWAFSASIQNPESFYCFIHLDCLDRSFTNCKLPQDQKDFKLLRASCTLQDIVEAMLNPNTGLSFICRSAPLPATTFVSAEAILWLMEHVESVASERRAIAIMEDMLARNMVRHASGDAKIRFLYGFHLYYILDKDVGTSSPYQGDGYAFKCDWIEVDFISAQKCIQI